MPLFSQTEEMVSYTLTTEEMKSFPQTRADAISMTWLPSTNHQRSTTVVRCTYSIFKSFSGVRSYKGIWRLTRCWATAKQCISSDLLKTGLKQRTEEASYSTTSPLICWREECQNRAYFLIVWRGVCNNKAPLLSFWKEASYSTASHLIGWRKNVRTVHPFWLAEERFVTADNLFWVVKKGILQHGISSDWLRRECRNSASLLIG